jgi:hypothetical protein
MRIQIQEMMGNSVVITALFRTSKGMTSDIGIRKQVDQLFSDPSAGTNNQSGFRHRNQVLKLRL